MKPWLVDNRYERMRGCTRKTRFSAGQAHRLARHYQQRTYLCNFCGSWHLTSKR